MEAVLPFVIWKGPDPPLRVNVGRLLSSSGLHRDRHEKDVFLADKESTQAENFNSDDIVSTFGGLFGKLFTHFAEVHFQAAPAQ